MATRRKSLTTWIIVAIVAIVVLTFAGLLPLPGQKDNVTSHSQPSAPGQSPVVEAPQGPPASAPSQPGQGTQPPPGGTPSASPGSPSGATATDAGPGR